MRRLSVIPKCDENISINQQTFPDLLKISVLWLKIDPSSTDWKNSVANRVVNKIGDSNGGGSSRYENIQSVIAKLLTRYWS